MPNLRVSLNKEEVLRLYFEERKSLSEIGVIFGCNRVTISNRFKEWGISARSISDSLKGRRISWGDKIGAAQVGKIISRESRRKISEATKGRIAPNKGLRKATHPLLVRYGMVGSKHWNWKGGISEENVRLRQSSEYKAWRDSVFHRDKYTCQKCEIRGGDIVAHHIEPFSVNKLKRFETENGQTLCLKCHKEITNEQYKNGVIKRCVPSNPP